MSDMNKVKKFDAIVCMSAIDWDFLWQRTQEFMQQFANMGYPILFVENTGVRMPGFRDLPRLWKRFIKAIGKQRQKTANTKSKNITVFSPMVLPMPYIGIIVKLNAYLIKRSIRAFAKQTGCSIERMLFWTYMTTPLARELSKSLPWAKVVVDLVSDPCKVKGAEKIEVSHKRLLQKADVIYCASNMIADNTRNKLNLMDHDKVKVVEDGFSVCLSELDHVEVKMPDQLMLDDRPIAVYIGGINDKIWWGAVSALAKSFPDVQFVFIGPKQYSELPIDKNISNVVWFPPFKKYAELGLFFKKCSVGLIPYVNNDYVAEMRPAKINEYMVSELPIVATRLPELERFSQNNGPGIVYTADTEGEFITAFGKALQEDSSDFRQKRKSIVLERTWEQVCREIIKEL